LGAVTRGLENDIMMSVVVDKEVAEQVARLGQVQSLDDFKDIAEKVGKIREKEGKTEREVDDAEMVEAYLTSTILSIESEVQQPGGGQPENLAEQPIPEQEKTPEERLREQITHEDVLNVFDSARSEFVHEDWKFLSYNEILVRLKWYQEALKIVREDNPGNAEVNRQATLVVDWLLKKKNEAETKARSAPSVVGPVVGPERGRDGMDPVTAQLMAAAGLNSDSDPTRTAAIMQFGEMMRNGEVLASTDLFDIENWVLRVLDGAVQNEYFFNGLGWQQVGPMMENEIRRVMKGKTAVEVNNALSLMRSATSLYCQETAILHADGDPTKYISFLPVAGVVTQYHWSQEAGSVPKKNQEGQVESSGILGHPIVNQIRRRINRDAYNPETGRLIMRHLKGENGNTQAAIDEWADQLANRITSNPEVMVALQNKMNEAAPRRYGADNVGLSPDQIRQMARAAIAVFIVEDYPDWVCYSAKEAKEEDGKDKVPWMFFTADEAKRENDNPINQQYHITAKEGDCRLFTRRKVLSSTQVGKVTLPGVDKEGVGPVEIWNSQFGNLTDVQHPVLSLVRPMDLYRFKGAWNEVILGMAERALVTLAKQKWNPEDKGFPPLSRIGAKDITRWSNMVGAWFGNTKAGDLDDWKKFMDGADSLADLLQGRADKSDLGGFVIGEIIAAKVMASFANRPDEFLLNLSRTLQIDAFATPKEIQEAQGAILGSTGLGQNGILAELAGRLSYHYRTDNYERVIAMLRTDSSDPEKAKMLLGTKRAMVAVISTMDVLTAIFTKGGGSKRGGR